MRSEYRKQSAIKLAVATIATSLCAAAYAGQSNDMVTISLSGSTAMRNFTTSAGFSYLTPGTSITLNSGPGGTPVVYTAPNGPATQYQLAPNDLTNLGSNDHAALRVEWHEQGSVEGVLELVNSQIGTTTDIVPSFNGGANPLWINGNSFSGPGSAHGFSIADFGQPGCQSAVQMAISDVNPRQGFARAGTGTFTATPGMVGYGTGNSGLGSFSLNGLGSGGARQGLEPASVLNMPASNFGAGAWNDGTLNNTQSNVVAVTATVLVANPGTGLTKLNRSDAQWLQTTGRLANGADFNVAQRDVNSGTRNVFALNTGVDPSWAVGENDAGNSGAGQNNVGTGSMTFSGKTTGGALRTTVRNNRMAVGPLSIGDAKNSNSVDGNNASSVPLRALDYADSATDAGANFVRVSASSITDGSYVIWQNETYVTLKAPSAAFAGDDATTWANRTDIETGILGDNAGHDVADFRANILTAAANYPASLSVGNPGDQLLNKAFILPQMVWKTKAIDGVGVATNKSADVNTDGPGYSASLRNALVGSGYAPNFNAGDPTTITKGANGSKYGGDGGGNFSAGSIALTDSGSGGGNYLFGNFDQNGTRDYASVVMSAQAAQDKLFSSGAGVDANAGSSNLTKVSGLSSALNGMAGSDGTSGATKGDLIVLGDYNGDGKFDGKDLFQLARGASLADSTLSTHLTSASGATLGDQLRNGVLRKNAALDYLATNATAQQRTDAAFNGHTENAFKKTDVNHDGVIDLKDAKLVDFYAGADYRKIGDQVSAYQGADGDSPKYTQSSTLVPISLVDVELNDTGNIDINDFHVIRNAVGNPRTDPGGLLYNGDSDFNGKIDGTDYASIDSHFNSQNQPGFIDSWGHGDFDMNGKIDGTDYAMIDSEFNMEAGSFAAALAFLSDPNNPKYTTGFGGMVGPDTPLGEVMKHYAEFGSGYATAFAATPEPSLGLVAVSAIALMPARRRRIRKPRPGC